MCACTDWEPEKEKKNIGSVRNIVCTFDC